MCSNRMGRYATMAARIRRSAFEKTLAPGDRRRADSLLRDVFFRFRLGPRLPDGPRPALQFLLAALLDRADVGVPVDRPSHRVAADGRPDTLRERNS